MPRKKAEPEVLQEETVQPEITETEEKAIMEQPTVEPQVEEPATSEPVQPYGEEEPSAAKEESESSEPEKKSFYDLDFCLRLFPQPKRHARHDHRRRSALYDRPQRTDRPDGNQADVLRGHRAVPRPHSDSRDGNVGGK